MCSCKDIRSNRISRTPHYEGEKMFGRKKKPKPIDWDAEFKKLLESEPQFQTIKNDFAEIRINEDKQLSLTLHIKGELQAPMVIAAIHSNFDVDNISNFERFMFDFLEAGGLFFSIFEFFREVTKNNLAKKGIFVR